MVIYAKNKHKLLTHKKLASQTFNLTKNWRHEIIRFGGANAPPKQKFARLSNPMCLFGPSSSTHSHDMLRSFSKRLERSVASGDERPIIFI